MPPDDTAGRPRFGSALQGARRACFAPAARALSFFRSGGLRETFQKWLFIFVVLVFMITIGVSYILQTRQADAGIKQLLDMELLYIKDQIASYYDKLLVIEENTEKNLVDKAHAVAFIVLANPAVLGDHPALRKICAKTGLDEIYISDENGTLVASVPGKYVGWYNYNDYPDTLKYLELIKNKDLTIVEKPRPNTGDQDGSVRYQQYAGVARLDRPGIIQVALSAAQYGRPAAAASIDSLVTDYSIGQRGYAVVISGRKVVSAPDREYIGRNAACYGLPEEVYANDKGMLRTKIKGEKVVAVYDRFSEFKVVAVAPEAEVYENRNRLMLWTSAVYFILFAVVFALISRLLHLIVIKGITQTNQSLGIITAGNLDEKVEVGTSDEFISLSNGINSTVAALKAAIAAEAARLDAELELARNIQLSTLHTVFPPYPDRSEFAIYAAMHTAKEVGGDFYDFFFVDDRHLVFVIADVSGKGIPAALFMMTAKTHIKNRMFQRAPLGRAVALVNRQLCEESGASMFVSAFIGILDVGSGLLTYVNAGHPPPLCRANGAFEWLRPRSGPVMGVIEEAEYQEASLLLKRGDRIFCYTDGVTEASDKDRRLFGDERLLAAMNANSQAELPALLEKITEAMDLFTRGAPRFDDVTMLALDYFGPAGPAQSATSPASTGVELCPPSGGSLKRNPL